MIEEEEEEGIDNFEDEFGDMGDEDLESEEEMILEERIGGERRGQNNQDIININVGEVAIN